MLPALEQLEVYCINLDRRPDRWAHVQAEWAELGCPPEHLHRVQGIDTGSHVGCARSHQKCVKHAQTANLPFICVLEDDVTFRPNTAALYEALRYRLPAQCSILYGGVSWAGSAEAELVPGIRELGECAGLFCVFYFASAYDAVLAWGQRDGNIDRFLGRRDDIVRLVTLPYLASTTSGHSDLRKRKTRDAEVIERVERKFLDSDPGQLLTNVIALDKPLRRGGSLKISRAMYERGSIGVPAETIYGIQRENGLAPDESSAPPPARRAGALPGVEEALMQAASVRRNQSLPGAAPTPAMEQALIQQANARRGSTTPAPPSVEQALMQQANSRPKPGAAATPAVEAALMRESSVREKANPPTGITAPPVKTVAPSVEMEEAIRQAAAQLRRELGVGQSQTPAQQHTHEGQ